MQFVSNANALAASLPSLASSGISQRVKLGRTSPAVPDRDLSPVRWVNDTAFLFDDGYSLYCFDSSCVQIWTLTAQFGLNGWVASGTYLSVLDGCVLYHYDLANLMRLADATPTPSAANNLETHAFWIDQVGGGSVPTLGAVQANGGGHHSYSAPALRPGDPAAFPTVFVLCDGTLTSTAFPDKGFTLVAAPSNLFIDPGQQTADATTRLAGPPPSIAAAVVGSSLHARFPVFMDDQIEIYEYSIDQLPAAFLSKTPFPAGPSIWRRMEDMLTSQRSEGFTRILLEDPCGHDYIIYATVGTNAAACWFCLCLVDNNTGQSHMLVSSRTIKNGNPDNPNTPLTALTPTAPVLPKLLCGPAVRWNSGTPFVYCVSQAADGPVTFDQYKLDNPAASAPHGAVDDAYVLFTMCADAATTWTPEANYGNEDRLVTPPLIYPYQLILAAAALQALGLPCGQGSSQMQDAASGEHIRLNEYYQQATFIRIGDYGNVVAYEAAFNALVDKAAPWLTAESATENVANRCQ